MRALPLSQRIVASLFLVVALGCSQDPIAPAVGGSLELSTPSLSFTESLQTAELALTVRDAAGAPISRPRLSFSSNDEAVAVVSARGVVTALANGRATITIDSDWGRAFATVDVNAAATPLADGLPSPAFAAAWRAWRYFSFAVPEGPPQRVLEVRLAGDAGMPYMDAWGCSAARELPDSSVCIITAPPAGTAAIAVNAHRDVQGVSLRARLLPMIALAASVPATGVSGARGDLAYFTIDVPANATVRFSATGASGDVDLLSWGGGDRFALETLYNFDPTASDWYADLWSGWCKSVDGTTSEACEATVGSESRTITVVLVGVTEFTDFSVLAEVTP